MGDIGMSEPVVIQTRGGEKLIAKATSTPSDVHELYDCAMILDEAGASIDESKHGPTYARILELVHSSDKCKKLAAPLIPKYFKYFPIHSDSAINCMLDLCEEDDIHIRTTSIRGLPKLCSDNPENVPKIADVLGQLLLAEDSHSISAVEQSFEELLLIDAIGSFSALFNQVSSNDIELRQKVISFLATKTIKMNPSIFASDKVQTFLFESINSRVAAATASSSSADVDNADSSNPITMDELKPLLAILSRLHPKPSTALLDAANASISSLSLSDPSSIPKYIQALDVASPAISAGAFSPSLFDTLSSHILPNLNKIPDAERLTLLKRLSMMSSHVSIECAKTNLSLVYSSLCPLMATPSITGPLFSQLECLLYIFYKSALKSPTSLNRICGLKIVTAGQHIGGDADMTDRPALLQEFRTSLKSIAEQSRGYKDSLVEALRILQEQESKASSGTEKQMAASKIAQVLTGIRTVKNVGIIASTFSRKPFDHSQLLSIRITPSWDPKQQAAPSSSASTSSSRPKRGSDEILDDEQKKEEKGQNKKNRPSNSSAGSDSRFSASNGTSQAHGSSSQQARKRQQQQKGRNRS